METPTYLSNDSMNGYVCLSIKLRDAITGHVFEAIESTAAEFLTSPCLIRDIT